jgi:hypothetical protein
MLNRHQIVLSVVILCFVSITLSAEQFHKPVSPAEKEHILDGPFTDVTKTEVFPVAVKQAFATISAEPSFALANPLQKFQVTDVNPDRALPRRRLIFAGERGDEWFVHYERGGLAHSYYVVAFKIDPHGDAHFVWGCPVADRAKTLERLRSMVAACRLSEEESYW